jgi:hypothetical protein
MKQSIYRGIAMVAGVLVLVAVGLFFITISSGIVSVGPSYAKTLSEISIKIRSITSIR